LPGIVISKEAQKQFEDELNKGLESLGLPEKYSQPTAQYCVMAANVVLTNEERSPLAIALALARKIAKSKMFQAVQNNPDVQNAVQAVNKEGQEVGSSIHDAIYNSPYNPFKVFNDAIDNALNPAHQ